VKGRCLAVKPKFDILVLDPSRSHLLRACGPTFMCAFSLFPLDPSLAGAVLIFPACHMSPNLHLD